MLSTVWETRVPSRTGKVSRIRPIRRASDIARAGSPRRAGRVADISTPIIVAEVTSRRRTGRPRQCRAHDPVPGGGAEEERERHQGAGDEDPGEVGADDAGDDVVDADLLGGERGEADAERPGGAEADAAGGPAAPVAGAGGLRVERGQPLRRAGRHAVGRPHARPVGGALERAAGLGRLDRPLVDPGDAVGDARPGVALGAAAGRLAHRRQPLGLVVGALQLLGEALRVARRDEDAVDAVGDDVAVAGDRRGDRRGAGGEGLGQDHAEALPRERGRAEQVGLVHGAVQRLARDAAADVDRGAAARGRRGSAARPRARRRSR